MQVINKIDHLITELNKLKPTLSDNSQSNEKRFNDLLTASIATGHTVSNEEVDIPRWVDPDYGYDPKTSRKPNMRELMEAMSGKNVEDLYSEPNENWQNISRQASAVLYGVVGTSEDTRDWLSIMNSSDILTEAREQTGNMHEPEVDILSNFNDKGILTEQIAVIKDSKGNILSSIPGNITSAKETLINFGATKDSIPTNLEERIDPAKFDDDLLAFLKNFDNKPTSIQQFVVQSASEAISNKLSQEIPLSELAKL